MSRTFPWCTRLRLERCDSNSGGDVDGVGMGASSPTVTIARRGGRLWRPCASRSNMLWQGTFLGAVIGLALTGRIWGAVAGALIGLLIDQGRSAPAASAGARSIAEVFFRTTFELMGHVAKADGRVSEAEIDAARRLMRELMLGPHEIQLAIECFRRGKTPDFDATGAVEELARVCALRP